MKIVQLVHLTSAAYSEGIIRALMDDGRVFEGVEGSHDWWELDTPTNDLEEESTDNFNALVVPDKAVLAAAVSLVDLYIQGNEDTRRKLAELQEDYNYQRRRNKGHQHITMQCLEALPEEKQQQLMRQMSSSWGITKGTNTLYPLDWLYDACVQAGDYVAKQKRDADLEILEEDT